VSSGDVDRAFAIARRIRTGNVTINSRSHFGINSPFGGSKQSGLGRRNGEEGFKEYFESKTIGMPES
ncbi:aldehyde dehydrogenase family protein, partial [Streptomyces edwardsiae]